MQTFLCGLMAVILVNLVKFESQAVQYPDGKLAFESAVLLVDTHATFNEIRARQARYYFDLELPDDAGESLGKVIIKQRAGGNEIEFKTEKTKAYLGTHRQKQAEIAVNTVYDRDLDATIVKFEQPISAPNELTIGLKPKRNPNLPGVYLFGVTAFPPGKRSLGLYLGAGRFHFKENDFFDF